MEMDHVVGLALLVEDGVQCLPEVQFGERLLDSALVDRHTGSQLQRREGAIVFSISAVDFFRRLITRVAEFITKIRRCFVFRLAKVGYPRVEDVRGRTANEIKVEEAASGACEPQLAEIIVSEKETTSRAESKLLDYEDSESNCTRQITVDDEQSGTCVSDNATLLADNYGTACQAEFASPCDPHLQIPANSAPCKPGVTTPSDLNYEHCTLQHDNCHCQDVSRGEELRDDEIRNKFLTMKAPSGACDSQPETSVEESALEQVATSKRVDKKFSIHQLNAMVAKQLIKYLHALESSMVPAATLTQKTTHWRAIILATLVAVAVWARNSRHLHESMPRIKGSRINVHIRSRL